MFFYYTSEFVLVGFAPGAANKESYNKWYIYCCFYPT